MEEAEDMKPPYKLDKLATDNVLEAESVPANCRELEIVEEAVEINPPDNVDKPVIPKVPTALTLPAVAILPVTAVIVAVPLTFKSLYKLVTPVTAKVEEAAKSPEIFKRLAIVEDAVEINPVKVESASACKVE